MNAPNEFTKAEKKRLRALCALAHERDLSAELARLEAAFQRWRAKQLDSFELSDLIHQFHQGPSQQIFLSYDRVDVARAVASAVHRGVLTESEVDTEILEHLRSQLAFLRDHPPPM